MTVGRTFNLPIPAQLWPDSDKSGKVLTIAEVAHDLRCSKAHVYNVLNGIVAGVSPLPSLSIGRRRLVRLSTLERWKRENERAPGEPLL